MDHTYCFVFPYTLIALYLLVLSYSKILLSNLPTYYNYLIWPHLQYWSSGSSLILRTLCLIFQKSVEPHSDLNIHLSSKYSNRAVSFTVWVIKCSDYYSSEDPLYLKGWFLKMIYIFLHHQMVPCYKYSLLTSVYTWTLVVVLHCVNTYPISHAGLAWHCSSQFSLQCKHNQTEPSQTGPVHNKLLSQHDLVFYIQCVH